MVGPTETSNQYSPSTLKAALSSLPPLQAFIGNLNEAALAELEESIEWYGIATGTTLFRQGDAACDMYIVTAGRLGVFVDVGLGAKIVAQIRSGELVGEMSLISDEPRSATVVALRNTELIRVPARAAERLMSSDPRWSLYMLRLLASRLKRTTHQSALTRVAKTIAVIPIDRMPLERELGDGLQRAFASLSRRAGLIDNSNGHFTSESLEIFENEHDVVVYLADDRGSAWTKRCAGQADRVIFVADADSVPDDLADHEIDAVRELHRPADLVLLARPDASRPRGATAWLDRFGSHEIFHVRRGSAADYARVARLTTGRAIGVVFSGGGARGFAHIGAVRALYAAGIPIDLVGGASIGAVIAGAVALGGDADAIGNMAHYTFVQNNPLSDYTIPLVALFRGRKSNRLVRYQFGDATIENLWKVFFCVSANLSTGKMLVHQQGLLWRAVRASTAIPGILPPSFADGEVLVDGGIMNNFPTDVMRSLARGRVIGIEVGSEMPLIAKASDIEERSLFWLLRNRRTTVPGILDILMRAGTVGSELQREASRSALDLFIQPDLGSIGLMSFDRFHEAIECGYRATMQAIERLEKTPGAANLWSTRAT